MNSNNSHQMNCAAIDTATSHISFTNMADYIYSSGREENFMATAAKINKHVMECPQCRTMYSTLLSLQEESAAYARHANIKEKTLLQMIGCFYSAEIEKSIETLLEECSRFQLLLSFCIKNMQELAAEASAGFAYPKLMTVMKSSSDDSCLEESESVIVSSLIDQNKNRVRIGLDGTLSLYFDAKEHPAGKRVMVIPDDETAAPQMIELTQYDRSLSYVRFEGVAPGRYTVVVEEGH